MTPQELRQQERNEQLFRLGESLNAIDTAFRDLRKVKEQQDWHLLQRLLATIEHAASQGYQRADELRWMSQ